METAEKQISEQKNKENRKTEQERYEKKKARKRNNLFGSFLNVTEHLHVMVVTPFPRPSEPGFPD